MTGRLLYRDYKIFNDSRRYSTFGIIKNFVNKYIIIFISETEIENLKEIVKLSTVH